MTKKSKKKESLTNSLTKDLLAAASVAFGITYVVPVVIILIKKDRFVRFNAFQSMLFFTIFIVLQWFSHVVSRMFFSSFDYSLPIVPIVTALALVIWIVMLYKAWMGDLLQLPVLGKYANKLLKNYN